MHSHDTPSALAARPTLSALLRAAGRRWPLATAVAGLLALAAGFVLWHLTPPRHNADVRLQVRRAPAGLFDQNAGDAAAELRAQAELAKSADVIRRAAEDPILAEVTGAHGWSAPAEAVARTLTVEAVPEQSAIRIRATEAGAPEAEVIARVTVNAYLRELKNRREQQLHQLKDALERDVAASVAREVPESEPPEPRVVVDPRLAATERVLAQVRDDRRKAAAELAALRAVEPPPPATAVVPAEAVNEAYRNDPFVQEKLRELKPIEDVIERTLRIAVLGEKEPALKTYLERRDAIRAELAERRVALQKDLEKKAPMVPRGPDREPQIRAAEERVASLGRQEDALEGQIKALRAAAERVVVPPPPKPVVRVAVPKDSESRQKLEEQIRHIEARGTDPYWVTLLGENVSVNAESVRTRQLATGAGSAGGFLIGVLLIGLAEFRARRVRTAGDVADGLGMPVFGTLPRLKVTPKTLSGLGKDGDPVDGVRSTLLGAVPSGPCVIVVTSAGAGEGKSALAAYLAASLARSWHKTVLINGDLSRPELRHGSDLKSGPGLAEVLRGEADPLDALHVTPQTRLWLMAAGRVDAAVTDALSRGEVRTALEPLRDQFDCVVVDAAALGAGTHALSFAPHADVVLLAVQTGLSRLPEVYSAWRQLEDSGCPVVGAVVLGPSGETVAPSASAARQPEAAAVA